MHFFDFVGFVFWISIDWWWLIWWSRMIHNEYAWFIGQYQRSNNLAKFKFKLHDCEWHFPLPEATFPVESQGRFPSLFLNMRRFSKIKYRHTLIALTWVPYFRKHVAVVEIIKPNRCLGKELLEWFESSSAQSLNARGHLGRPGSTRCFYQAFLPGVSFGGTLQKNTDNPEAQSSQQLVFQILQTMKAHGEFEKSSSLFQSIIE